MSASARGWGAREGKKNRAAYNSHVQHDRLEKYYSRKKALGKYKRACRFEARSQTAETSGNGSSLLQQALKRDASELEDEYERKLSLSFGGSSSSTSTGEGRPQKRLGKQKINDELGEEQGNGKVRLKKIKRRQASSDIGTVPEAIDSPDAEATSKAEKAKIKKLKRKKVNDLPDRFSKDLKQFNSRRDAEAKERQRRLDEELSRKRRRRETAKGRAMKGQLLSQKTMRGQPKMQSILEAVTAKIMGEKQQLDKQKPRHQSESGEYHRSRRQHANASFKPW